MSCPRGRSRSGCSATSCSSSGTTPACAPLAGEQAQLLEPPGLAAGEDLRLRVGERRPAPQGERRLEHRTSRLRPVGRERRLRLAEQALEAGRVQPLRLQIEEVALPARHDQARLLAELLPQPRGEHLEPLHRGRRRIVGPELVHEPVARHDPVQVHEEERQKGALLGRPERQARASAIGLDRPQYPERRLLQCRLWSVENEARGVDSRPVTSR
jgi:hypothetical protein